MHGSAISLAEEIASLPSKPDALLVSDMTDLATLRSLLAIRGIHLPTVLYFHENQLTYPWSPSDPDPGLQRDHHYGWINYTSALAADRILFNSAYHLNSFTRAIAEFLNRMPDDASPQSVDQIREKSSVCAPGIDLKSLHAARVPRDPGTPIVIWNHRWEFDKNPELFFDTLIHLANEGAQFRLVVLGESFSNYPGVFDHAREQLKSHILQWGYCESREEYFRWLWRGHLLPVTARQDFFGYSVVEGKACGLLPLLPARLAYPEHSSNPHHFYKTDSEFPHRLAQLINGEFSCAPGAEEVSRYDWPQVIPEIIHGLKLAIASALK